MAGDKYLTRNNAAGLDLSELPATVQGTAVSKVAFPVNVALPEQPAENSYREVLEKAGAIYPVRDAVDQRIVNETKKRTASGKGTKGNGIIDDPSDVGGWPTYKMGVAPTDTDEDGMPDDWERKQGLNPNDAHDGNFKFLNKNYTNLEIYINGFN